MTMGMRPQERSSLGMVSDRLCTVYANERSSSIDMDLHYDSTVMLTCKLLFAAAKAIVDVGPHRPVRSPRSLGSLEKVVSFSN